MVIFKIQTYFDVVSGQKLQKILFLSDHDHIFIFLRNGASDEKKYKDNSVGN